MKTNEKWYLIVLLLYDLELDKEFEKFIKNHNIITDREKLTDLDYEVLSTSVEYFFEEIETKLEPNKKAELLKYCNPFS